MKLKIKTLRVTNGIIESKKTKEMDNDSVKQSSFMNSLKDMDNNLYPLRFVCMLRMVVLIDGNGFVFPPVIGKQPHRI
jgi:hypothetical protein